MSKVTPQVKAKCAQCGKDIRNSFAAWMFPKRTTCQCNTRAEARTTIESRAPAVLKTADDPQAASMIGKTIDNRYQILSHIGTGGMASVYRVRDVNTGKLFALKMIVAHLAEHSVLIRRLANEAEAIAVLSHPGICRLHHVGETEEKVPYMVMDLIEGESLDDILRRQGPLSYSTALEIFIQAAEALSHAHANNITHRDLKPSNIIITKTNTFTGTNSQDETKLKETNSAAILSKPFTLSIVDFGIAKISDEQRVSATKLTQTGELIGSPLYMSPEQCRGDQLDGRSDIYSLGCVMYELISGRTPFEGDAPVKIILKHLLEEATPLNSESQNLNHVVSRCLAKEASDRYQSCDELVQDLKSIENGAQIAPYKPKKLASQKKTWMTAASIAATVLVIFAAAGFFLTARDAINEAPVISDIDLVHSPWAALDLDGQAKFNRGNYKDAEQLFRKALSVEGTSEAQQRLSLEKLSLLLHVIGDSTEEGEIDRELASFKKDPSISTDSDADLVKLLKNSMHNLDQQIASAQKRKEKTEYAKHLAQDVSSKIRRMLTKEQPDTDAALVLIDSALPQITSILGEKSEAAARLNEQKARAIMLERHALITTRMLSGNSEAVLKLNRSATQATTFAISVLEKSAEKHDPDLGAAYTRMAYLSNESGDPKNALRFANLALNNFSHSLHIRPDQNNEYYQQALLESARAEELLGNATEAIKSYDKILDMARKKQDVFEGEALAEDTIKKLTSILSKSKDESALEEYARTQLKRSDNPPLIRAALDMALAAVYFDEKIELANQFPSLSNTTENKTDKTRKKYKQAEAYLRDALRIRQHLEQSPFTEEVLESSRQLLRLDHLLIVADNRKELKAEAESLARQNLAIFEKSANSKESRRLAYAYLDLAVAMELQGDTEQANELEKSFNKQLALTQGYALQDEAASAAANGNDKNLTYAKALLSRSAFCCARKDIDNAKRFSQQSAALVLQFKPNELDERNRDAASSILRTAALFEPANSPAQQKYRTAANEFLLHQ
ncbi:MAG: serine/threonine protein kinase [Candidatus Obscuribacterales bacterium]|nr:serine/threonine protein kinase [Candidatus Obscuribacterales bacterium]